MTRGGGLIHFGTKSWEIQREEIYNKGAFRTGVIDDWTGGGVLHCHGV